MMNALMAIPNLIGLLALAGKVVEETKRYFRDRGSGVRGQG
jgi:Na+/alanine symporter